MKRILGLVLLCAATAFAANPSLYIPWTAIRGTNGITATTNPSLGIVIFDPRAFTNDAGFSNRVVQLVNANAPSGPWTNSNGTISNSVASTVSNFVFSSSVQLGDMPLVSFKVSGTNVITITPFGGIFAKAAARNEPVYPGAGLLSHAKVHEGDVDFMDLTLKVTDTDSDHEAYDTVNIRHDSYIRDVFVNEISIGSANIYAELTPAVVDWGLYKNFADMVRFRPTVADGTTPHTFNTSIAHTSGNLLEVKNAGVTHFSIASTNGPATPQITAYGATSHPWLFGSVVQGATVTLNTTNYVEVVINGVLRKLLLANP